MNELPVRVQILPLPDGGVPNGLLSGIKHVPEADAVLLTQHSGPRRWK